MEEGTIKTNNFVFENSTKVYFRNSCVKEYLADLLTGYGNNVILAYGGGSIKTNVIYNENANILNKTGKAVTEFADIMPNPTYTKVLEGAALAKENQIENLHGLQKMFGNEQVLCFSHSPLTIYIYD